MSVNPLNVIITRAQEFMYIIWSKIAIANCPLVMCYKLTSDLFLTIGEGWYPKRWVLLGMLPLVNDWQVTCIRYGSGVIYNLSATRYLVSHLSIVTFTIKMVSHKSLLEWLSVLRPSNGRGIPWRCFQVSVAARANDRLVVNLLPPSYLRNHSIYGDRWPLDDHNVFYLLYWL